MPRVVLQSSRTTDPECLSPFQMTDRNTNVVLSHGDASARLNRRLTEWSLLIIAGQFTGDHLRRAVGDPLLSNLVSSGSFRGALEKACEQIRPEVTKDASLLLELSAVERKLARLFVERSYRQS